MAKWAHADVLDGGLTAIKTAATRMILVSDYTDGDSYSTVQTNKLAEVTMVNGDFVISNGSAGARLLTSAAGKIAVASASSDVDSDLHFVFTDGASKVLWATDESSDIDITAASTYIFPALTYTSAQPV